VRIGPNLVGLNEFRGSFLRNKRSTIWVARTEETSRLCWFHPETGTGGKRPFM